MSGCVNDATSTLISLLTIFTIKGCNVNQVKVGRLTLTLK